MSQPHCDDWMMIGVVTVCVLQTLLRGVVPDSFPSRLSLEPCERGERRLVVVDDNVYRIYGAQLREVCYLPKPWMCLFVDWKIVLLIILVSLG